MAPMTSVDPASLLQFFFGGVNARVAIGTEMTKI